VIIATIQRPTIPLNLLKQSIIIIINPLQDDFIQQCIERWYFILNKKPMLKTEEIGSIIGTIGGHPLSAQLVASYLSFESPSILNRQGFIRSFRKNAAEYVLRSFKNNLSTLEILLLEIIANI